jgi:hypothetical protein
LYPHLEAAPLCPAVPIPGLKCHGAALSSSAFCPRAAPPVACYRRPQKAVPLPSSRSQFAGVVPLTPFYHGDLYLTLDAVKASATRQRWTLHNPRIATRNIADSHISIGRFPASTTARLIFGNSAVNMPHDGLRSRSSGYRPVVFIGREMTRVGLDSMLRSHPRATRSNSRSRARAKAVGED